MRAAEAELARMRGRRLPGPGTAAFALLAADAYVTYACLWAITGRGKPPVSCVRIAERITRGMGPPENR